MPDYLQFALAQIQTFLLMINQYLTPKGCFLLAGVFFVLLIFLKLKIPAKNKTVRMIKNDETLSAIAGDDVVTTQLDLARAYIEMDQKNLAREILEQVIHQGNASQQQEAKLLMSK